MNLQKDLTYLIGQKFNRLTILSIGDRKIFKSVPTGITTVWCQCECGKINNYQLSCIKNGNTKSCGCFNIERSKYINYKHGFANVTPIYRLWKSIKRRCYTISTLDYKDYGGRGIQVCNEWKNDFVPFNDWCINNGFKKGLQIDRIDNNGNYEPSNCRFVTNIENSRNRRSNCNVFYNGSTKTVTEWCEILNLNYRTIKQRITRGWSIKNTFEIPIRQKVIKMIALFILIPLFSISQPNMGISYGYSTTGQAIATGYIGYEASIFNITGEIRPSISRNVAAHNYVGGRVSINLIEPVTALQTGFSILPGIGYYYDLRSMDKTNLNKYYLAGTLKAILMINDNGGLFLDGMYINKSVQIMAGIHFKFTQDKF